MKTRAVHVVFLMVISGIVGYYIGTAKVDFAWKNYTPQVNISNKQPPPELQTVDFEKFWTVWQKIQNSYYDKTALDSQKMLNGAISGMVEALEDPYTVYLPPQQNNSFKEGLAGKFEGIGAELGMKGKQIIVVAPLDGSPAQKSGIKPEDAIVKVNGQATFGWTLSQAVEKIRGPKGTPVDLSVIHKGSDKISEVKIVRDTITIKSVDGWVKKISNIESIKGSTLLKGKENNEIAYIRLSQFGDNTNREWLSLVNNLSLQINNSKNVKGLILDLRNNPGGYLTEANYIASEFLKSGVVVSQDKGNGDTLQFSVVRQGLLLDIPMVVLINKGSASASEIVAGALRDHNRAKLIGETSFGKGTIQAAEDLGEGAGIHVTIAKWLTPKGTWVHGKGLTPDVMVELDSTNQDRDNQLEKAIEQLVK